MKNQTLPGDQRLLWITDPHLESASQSTQDKVITRLESSDYDMAVITGDLATAATLPKVLPILAEACANRRLFITLGNHDFAKADVRKTLSTVDQVSRRHGNLVHLTTSPPMRITQHTTLVGHHGLTGQPQRKTQDAAESSEKLLHGIFYARKTGTQLLAATHYPPFHSSTLFNDRRSDVRRQSYYCNGALGYMLIVMAKKFGDLPIRIIAGHTHHPADDAILYNLSCRVGRAGPGHTGIQGIVMV